MGFYRDCKATRDFHALNKAFPFILPNHYFRYILLESPMSLHSSSLVTSSSPTSFRGSSPNMAVVQTLKLLYVRL